MLSDVLVHGAQGISRAEFALLAARVAAQLPARRFLVNLCERRFEFMLTFASATLARQIQLLPASRGAQSTAALTQTYADSHAVDDADVQRWRESPAAASPTTAPSEPPAAQAILIAFTSGSTGRSQAHPKSWRALATSAELNGAAIRAALGVAAHAPVSLLGTVPSHHMYGIEFTVMLPLCAGMSVHGARPLYPADVAGALAELPPPAVLVSTPFHLRALVESDMAFPPVALVVSATAPLDAALAARVESRFGVPLLEMFGSTETCVIARRRTALGEAWRPYNGVELVPAHDTTRVSAPWFDQAQQLQDIVEPAGAGFILRGRNSDLVEVAGKRASLADITRRLCALDGVEDAVAFQPDAGAGIANRVAALVVSRGPTAHELSRSLARELDAVFLPRPLVLVERIPRDAVGKIPRTQLLELAGRSGA